jgi:hypothetical protein
MPWTFIALLTRIEQRPMTIQMVNVTDELMLVNQLNAVSAPLLSDMNARSWNDPVKRIAVHGTPYREILANVLGAIPSSESE